MKTETQKMVADSLGPSADWLDQLAETLATTGEPFAWDESLVEVLIPKSQFDVAVEGLRRISNVCRTLEMNARLPLVKSGGAS